MITILLQITFSRQQKFRSSRFIDQPDKTANNYICRNNVNQRNKFELILLKIITSTK